MQSKYLKAVIIGVLGVIALIALLYCVSYLSEKQTEEWYKKSDGGRLYDNDMAGLAYGAMMAIGALVIVTLAGGISVLWSIEDIRSPAEAFKVSAITFVFPGLLVFAGILLLGILERSYGPSPQITPGTILAGFTSGLFILGLVLFCLCILCSAISGISCYILFSTLITRPETKPVVGLKRTVLVGVPGAIAIFFAYGVSYFLTGGSYAIEYDFYCFLFFVTCSVLCGMLLLLAVPVGRLTRGILFRSALVGIIIAAGGTLGRLLVPLRSGYNVGGVLLTEGLSYLISGIVFTLMGTVLYLALMSKEQKADVNAPAKHIYTDILVIGSCLGIVLELIGAITPPGLWLLLLVEYAISTILMGMLSVRLSRARSANEAAAAGIVAGSVVSAVLVAGDLIVAFLRTNSLLFGTDTLSPEVYATVSYINYYSNLSSTIGWASVKVLLIIAIVCLAGMFYIAFFKVPDAENRLY